MAYTHSLLVALLLASSGVLAQTPRAPCAFGFALVTKGSSLTCEPFAAVQSISPGTTQTGNLHLSGAGVFDAQVLTQAFPPSGSYVQLNSTSTGDAYANLNKTHPNVTDSEAMLRLYDTGALKWSIGTPTNSPGAYHLVFRPALGGVQTSVDPTTGDWIFGRDLTARNLVASGGGTLQGNAALTSASIATPLPISSGGSGASSLNCAGSNVLTSNGTSFSCTAVAGGQPMPLSVANGGAGVAGITCSAGQFLTSNGTTYSCSAPGGGVGPRRSAGTTAYLSWPLAESAVNLVNEGTAGANGNLDTITGAMTLGRAGLFNNSLLVNSNSSGSHAAYSTTSTGLEPTYPITLMVWYKSAAVNSVGLATMPWKLYRPVASGLASPFYSWALRVNDSTGSLSFYVTVGGVLKTVATAGGSPNVVTPGSWHLLYGSYDGATMQVGADGIIMATAAQTGAIDYGTHGPIGLGNAPGETTATHFHYGADPRIYTSIISTSTFINMYRLGIGLY